MIERVARVLFHWQYGHNRWDEAEPEEREDVMEAARAAIEPMREPTEAMTDAGTTETNSEEDAIECWQAMINEALKE